MVSDDVVVTMVSLLAWAVVASVMWLRASQARRQLQDRMWGLAAAQGLPVGSLSGEVPVALQGTGDRRVQNLEAQIEQMAQQIDRLAESQEFLSRVLTDRIDQLPDPRLRTPH